jgi:Ca2+:H+ antiporter
MSSMEAGLVRKYPSDASGLRAARYGPHGHSASARTAHSMSASALRKKSDASLVRKVPCAPLRPVLANLQEVFLGTKLAVLFPAVPLAIAARYAHFGQVRALCCALSSRPSSIHHRQRYVDCW